MKKYISVFVCMTMLASLFTGLVFAEPSEFAGGSGTEADPYLISNEAELALLSNHVWNAETTSGIAQTSGTEHVYNVYTDTYFKLTADIDLGGREWLPIGRYARTFNGHFDGGGHVISNVSVTKQYIAIGFFGRLGRDASVEKLGLENVNIVFSNASNTPLDKETSGLDRTQAVGAFAGLVGGGTVKHCYVRDAHLENTQKDRSENYEGGFIGRGWSTEHHDTSAEYKNNPMRIENCYVMNPTALGSVNASHSGFIGINSPNSNVYRCDITFQNCYVGGTVTLTEGNANTYGFGRRERDETTAVNSYSVSDLGSGLTNAIAVTVSAKDEIVGALCKTGAYAPDNTTGNINYGYPVLVWEAYWLAGAEETDILNRVYLNTITNGQSPDYIFRDLNFVRSLSYGGKEYEIGWTSSNTSAVTNEGVVIHSKRATEVQAEVLLHNVTDDTFLTETLSFVVTERGDLVDCQSFDALSVGSLESGANLSVSGDSAAFFVENSISGDDSDHMIAIRGNGDDNIGALTYRLPQSFTTGKYRINLSFRCEQGGKLALRLGADEITVSADTLTVNESQTSIEPLGDTAWGVLSVLVNRDNATVSVGIGGHELSAASLSEELSSITFTEQDGTAYMDRLLMFEQIPGELDGVDYALILSGQERFSVLEDLNLPQTLDYRGQTLDLVWQSSNAEVITSEGRVNPPQISQKVTLTVFAMDADGETVLQAKTFEVYAVPRGSSLVYAEDFESAERENQGISSYQGWRKNPTDEWVSYSLTKAPDAPDTAEFADANKVLSMNRIKVHSAEETAPVESILTDIDTVYDGIMEFNFDIYYTSLSSRPLFRILNTDNVFVTEMYLQGKQGYFSKTGLNGIAWFSWNVVNNRWHSYRIVLDTTEKTFEVWVDGVKSRQTVRYTEANDAVKTIGFGSQRAVDTANPWYIDNLIVRNLMPADDKAVALAGESLSLPEEIGFDTDLPQSGAYVTRIWWESSDAQVISPAGIVTRGDRAKTVTLTAHVLKGAEEYTKRFTVTVPAETAAADAETYIGGIADRLSFSSISEQSQFYVTDDLNLISEYQEGDARRIGGVDIIWNSSNPEVISNAGKVSQANADTCVELTAVLTAKRDKSVTAEKTFRVYVPQLKCNDMIYEDFEGYAMGSDLDGQGRWTASAPTSGVSTVMSKVLCDPDDADNHTLAVVRHAFHNASEQPIKLAAAMNASDILFSTMFLLKTQNQVINLTIGGVEQDVVIKQNLIKVGDAEAEVALHTDAWYKLSVYYDGSGGVYKVYLDDAELAGAALEKTGQQTIDGIAIQNKPSDNSSGAWYLDDMIVRDISLSDEEAVELSVLALDFASDVIEWDIEDLPHTGNYGTTITWSSSNPSVLEDNGTVHRSVGTDYTVELTATVTKNRVSQSKVFTFTIPALAADEKPTQEILERHAAQIPFSYYTSQNMKQITSDIDLKTEYSLGNTAFYGGLSVSWTSSMPNVIDNSGKVVRQVYDVPVTLTAVYSAIRAPELQTKIEYKVIVWAEGEVLVHVDFEDVPQAHENAEVYDVDPHFEEEVRAASESGEKVYYSKDYQDRQKSWDEANKVICVDRYKYNTASQSIQPQRTKYYFDEAYTPDAIALSFDYMMDASDSRADITLLSLGKWYIIKPGVLAETWGMRPAMEPRKWYTYTIIMMQSAGMIKVLRDGVEFYSGFEDFTQSGLLTGIQFDVDRGSGLSKYYIDNIIVRQLNDSDEAAVNEVYDKLSLDTGNPVSADLPLRYTGDFRTSISYQSSNLNVIGNDGTYFAPSAPTEVDFTAYIRRGSYIKSKLFTLTTAGGGASKAFSVQPLSLSDRKLSEIGIVKNTDYEGEAKLIVAMYSQGRLAQTRCVDLGDLECGSHTVSFHAMDVSEEEYYTVSAYVLGENSVISNKEWLSY